MSPPPKLPRSCRRVALLRWSTAKKDGARKDLICGITPDGQHILTVYLYCRRGWGVCEYYTVHGGRYPFRDAPHSKKVPEFPTVCAAKRAAQAWWRGTVERMLAP